MSSRSAGCSHEGDRGSNASSSPPAQQLLSSSASTTSLHHSTRHFSHQQETDLPLSLQAQEPASLVCASPAAARVPAPPTTQRLCVLAVGVVVFHVLTSALQELIFHLPGFTNVLLLSFGETLCTTALVAVQMLWMSWRVKRHESGYAEQSRIRTTVLRTPFQPIVFGMRASCAAACSRVCVTLQRTFHPSTVKLHWYLRIALLVSCSLYLTNQTSFLLSYPLQVIFKSSKLLCMVLVRRWWMRPDGGGKSTTDDETCSSASSSTVRCEGVIHLSPPLSSRHSRAKHTPNTSNSRSSRTAFSWWTCWCVFCAKKTVDTLMLSLCSVGHGRHFLVQRLRRVVAWVSDHPHAFSARAIKMALHDSPCTRSGMSALFRVCLRQLRVFLQDGEMQACTLIVLGLILFTYASHADLQVSVAAAADAEYVLYHNETLKGATTTTTTNTTTPAAAAPRSQLTQAWDAVTNLYALWFLTMIGVSGVMLSNLLDAVIYVLEEVHCFLTAGTAATTTLRSFSTRKNTLPREAAAVVAAEQGGAAWCPPASSPAAENVFEKPGATSVSLTSFPHSMPHAAGTPKAVTTKTSSNISSAVSPSFPPLTAIPPSEAANSPVVNVSVAGPLSSTVTGPCPPSSSSSSASPPSSPPPRIPASSQEVLLIINGLASLLYAASLALPWLSDLLFKRTANASHMVMDNATAVTTSTNAAAPAFPLRTFTLLIVLASVTSLIGTLCLLSIVAEYTGVMAVVVTNIRKTLTILLSFVLYGRRFTTAHAVGLAGVMGGVVWNELLRRQRTGVKS